MSLWWCAACKSLTGPNPWCAGCGGPVEYAVLGGPMTAPQQDIVTTTEPAQPQPETPMVPDAPAPDREQRLEEIRQRSEAATPGPWVLRNGFGPIAGSPYYAVKRLSTADGFTSVVMADPPRDLTDRDFYGRMQDLEFIAHAREDVPWLIAQLKAARLREDGALKLLEDGRAENDRLREKLQLADECFEELSVENARLVDALKGLDDGCVHTRGGTTTAGSEYRCYPCRARAALASPAPETP